MIVFIRFLFIYFICLYNFNHLFKNKGNQIFNIWNLCLSLVLALLTVWGTYYATFLCFILPLLLLFSLYFMFNLSFKLLFTFFTLSLALSYCTFFVSSALVSIIMGLIAFYKENYYLILSTLLSGCLQTTLSVALFKVKRLRNGMPFLASSNFLNFGMILSCVFITLYFYAYLYVKLSLLNGIPIAVFISFGLFLLLHWWQSQLTKAYRKRLAQIELESLRTELEQKSILLKKLEAQNEEMGRLIHKDNKLIPAMEHAVSTYLTSDFTDLALQQAQGEALLTDLKELSAARQGILSTFTPAATPKYETGIPSLDAILVYMYQKAQSNGIRFYATATQESIAKCPTKLTNEKLVHLLSDLLENAIIATKSSSDKQIQLQIYLANGIFTIEIADTGLSFEPATLISFGLEKASTHLKDGGSGIGLLDIWKIKEEVKASIHIHEYETGTPFSKKIFISFDNRNKYVIHTWRDKELAPLVNRGDLVLISQNQQTA